MCVVVMDVLLLRVAVYGVKAHGQGKLHRDEIHRGGRQTTKKNTTRSILPKIK